MKDLPSKEHYCHKIHILSMTSTAYNPFCRHFLLYELPPHFYKKILTPQSPSMIFQNLKPSIYRGGRNMWSGWIFCSKQIPKVGGTFSSRFSKLDVFPCTVIFLEVLGVLDYKAKSTSYTSVKHLLKTKNKINKKFQKKNKQDKETYSEVYSLTSIYFLIFPWYSSQTLWNLCGCPGKISLVSISITLATESRNKARNMLFPALKTTFLRKRNQCSVYIETLMSCLTDWFFWEKHLQETKCMENVPNFNKRSGWNNVIGGIFLQN